MRVQLVIHINLHNDKGDIGLEYTKEQQYTNQQIQNVQQILYDLDNNSIRILREYIESEELPEINGV